MVSILTWMLLVVTYGVALLASILGSLLPRRRWKPTGRIMATGTFHNPNWYLSHVIPLTLARIEELILVVDEPHQSLERVRCVCPPRLISKLFGRAISKFLWVLWSGLRYKPDLYMGYHIAPGGCTALVAGKLLGRPACYQMTGGPIELMGGGAQCDGWPWNRLARSYSSLEYLALAVVKQFDLVVVRGSGAKAFLADHGIRRSVSIITGSVNGQAYSPLSDRFLDLVFVGRLAPIKQPEQVVDIVAEAVRIRPSFRAAIVGDGPMVDVLQARAADRSVTDHLEFLGKRRDVDRVLSRAKTFVLTSRSEGLSIAMAEAMAAGVVPVVPNVGELGDLVRNGENGWLVEPNQIDQYVDDILTLIRDEELWGRLSRAAVKAARSKCHVSVIAQRWANSIGRTVEHARSRCN